MRILSIATGLWLSAAAGASAGEEAFSTGPVFDGFGPAADIETTYPIPEGATFRLAFDTRVQADAGALNKTLEAAARFYNMHARAGVPADNIELAVVIHGGAVRDVTNAAHYAQSVGGENANAALVGALIGEGVKIILCGQSAAYYNVGNDDLLPGVEMAISAMTAHALLQQAGYALNPF